MLAVNKRTSNFSHVGWLKRLWSKVIEFWWEMDKGSMVVDNSIIKVYASIFELSPGHFLRTRLAILNMMLASIYARFSNWDAS